MENVTCMTRSEYEIEVIKNVIADTKRKIEQTNNATELMMLRDKVLNFEANLQQRLKREHEKSKFSLVCSNDQFNKPVYQKRKI